MTDTILYSRTGHVGRLVLNNPERHNSLGVEELEAIRGYLTEVGKDGQLRVLLVTGAGEKTFCAGASLKQLGAGQIDGDSFRDTTDQLALLEIPTICALNGNVFGAGVELALCCDFRIGVEGTRMRVPAAAIGLCYPPAGINRFVGSLGANLAKRILVAAEEFTAKEMLEMGFLDHLVAPERLEEHTQQFADHIAGLAPLAVRAMKAIVQQAVAGSIDVEGGIQLVKQCQDSDDIVEGLAAQREKRAPSFSGK